MNIKVKVKDLPYNLPKGMTVRESEILDKRIGNRVKATAGRKKPRNPNERETLLRWQKERGGTKIGDI